MPTLRLKTAYSFEPVPDSVDPKLDQGRAGQSPGQNRLYNTRHLQYMIWPRQSLAASRMPVVALSPKKDWNSFARRTESHFSRMDVEQVKYARSMFRPHLRIEKR